MKCSKVVVRSIGYIDSGLLSNTVRQHLQLTPNLNPRLTLWSRSWFGLWCDVPASDRPSRFSRTSCTLLDCLLKFWTFEDDQRRGNLILMDLMCVAHRFCCPTEASARNKTSVSFGLVLCISQPLRSGHRSWCDDGGVNLRGIFIENDEHVSGCFSALWFTHLTNTRMQ